MILNTEYDIAYYNILFDVESLKLSIENTQTNTITINKTNILYNSSLIVNKLLINHQDLNVVAIS